MLGFVFAVDAPGGGRELTVYVSGDTEFGSFPEGPFDAAVVSCGGMLMNPSTRRPEGPFLDEVHLARAASETLRAGVLVPVHYDHPVFLTPFDIDRLRAELETRPQAPRLLACTYGVWETLLAP
jgi:L-ascorbate metabolism protein UlaG (beta-lactamase superfamily)